MGVSWGRFLMQAAHILAFLEVQGIPLAIADYNHIHEFAGILGGAGSKAVETQGIFIVAIPAVLTAGIEFTEDQLPVIPLLCLIPIYRAAAALVVHLDRAIQIADDGDEAAIASPSLVNGVG